MSDRKITIFIKDCKPIILTDDSKNTTLNQLTEKLNSILESRENAEIAKFETKGDILLIPSDMIAAFMISHDEEIKETKPIIEKKKTVSKSVNTAKTKNSYDDVLIIDENV